MNKLSNGRENMSKEQLMGVCDQLEQELVGAQAVNKAYKKHLEQVIEYHSVEKYRSIVQKNREANRTADTVGGTVEKVEE
ncbi:hypothetical protein KQI33_02640 [Enterococcus devriesei]|uniref:hypothetical protein n=1 Tax=Enterococcus devriesei TaxID=319970 RepID=UPI001C11292F|nr:hypothetical protein [Enterococcus devriesei]MBU5364273.1 hypothetical protein [Enterococcus devriesei]